MRRLGPILTWIEAAVLAAVTLANQVAAQPKEAGGKPLSPEKLAAKIPGKSYRGRLPALTKQQQALRDALRKDIEKLAGEIGERNLARPRKYAEAAGFIETSLKAAGYDVLFQDYKIKGHTCRNLEVQINGTKRPGEIVVIGAHYDSAPGCPAANDNGSGVAGVLALARAFSNRQTQRTLRFVLFANEEPPYFQTEQMGSLVYARRCRKRDENIVAMLSLETIGYYSDKEDSQQYPPLVKPFFPSTGNFVGFVGNLKSRALIHQVVGSFRKHAKFPSEAAALPALVEGVGWSDHWSFWQVGYPGLMVTDTAPFRYPHYHQPTDTPDKIVYDRMARVVDGLEKVVGELADPERVADPKPRKAGDETKVFGFPKKLGGPGKTAE